MPLAKISTNAELSTELKDALHENAANALADCLKKPIEVCMVLLEDGCSMSFGGDGSVCGLIEVSGIDLTGSGASIEQLAKRLGGDLASFLGTVPERVFVKITDVPRGMWGNGKMIFY